MPARVGTMQAALSGGTRVASSNGMARSAALQSRRTAEAGARVSAVPERVELRIVHPYRRREPKTPYLLITVEWVVLTTIGAVALALATG